MSRSRVAAAALAVLVLAGCSPTVAMSPAAPNANDPDCAAAIVRMPEQLGDYPLRTTDAQGTAAWGEPTAALLYCGVPVPQISELPCIEIGGVFWLREEVDAGLAFTTYGRDPAVRVVVDTDDSDGIWISPGIALDGLAYSVSFLSGNGRECLDLDNTVSGEDLLEEETPEE